MKKKFFYNLILVLLFATTSFANVVDFVVSDGYGPYKLSKNNPENLEVFLGKNIVEPTSYNVNQEKATIFFAKPIQIGKVIKITYTVGNFSKENPNNLTLNSYKDDSGNISMVDGKYNSRFFGGDFGMNFALKNQDNTLNDNSAVSMSYNKNFGKLTFGTTYTTTGENLNNVQNYKTSNDLLELLASYNENNVTLDTKYIQYEETGRAVFDNKGSYTFANGTKFSLGYNNDNSEAFEKDTYNYALERRFGSVNTRAYGQNVFDTNSKYNKYGGEISNNIFYIGATNENTFSDNQKIKINNYKGSLNANAVNLDVYNKDTFGNNYLNEKNANINIKNNKGNLSFGITINEEDGEKTGSKNTASGSYQIGKHTTLGGAYSGVVTGSDIVNTYEGSVKWTLGQKLGLSSSYKNSRKNLENPYSEITTSLVFNPNEKMAWTVDYLNRELSKDSRFSKLKLTGNYEIDKLKIYALYIDRKSSTNFVSDTKSAKLTYSLLKFLEISSQWTENPLNKDNAELYNELVEYNYGLRFIFGDVSLSGNAYQTKDAFDFLNNEKYDFGLSAKMFGGSLSGNVTLDNSFGLNNNYYRKYSLGFSKSVKNKWTFGISGSYDERNTNNGGFNPGDIQGNLHLGVNF